MSVLDQEISSVGLSDRDCGDDNDAGDEEDDGDENGSGASSDRCRCRGGGKVEQTKKKKQQSSSGIGFSRNLGKAKQVVLSPFTKAKKNLPRRNSTKSSSASAASSRSTFFSGKIFGVSDGNKGCYLCFMQPLTVDSSVESPSSDPNSPRFSYGKLRNLIEKNDFYCRECNHHTDFDPT